MTEEQIMEYDQERILKGIAVSAGYAIGYCTLIQANTVEISEKRAGSIQEELERLETARLQTVEQLEQITSRAQAEIGMEEAKIFESHILMANDPEYLNMIRANITQDGCNAALAIRNATSAQVAFFLDIKDEYFQARAIDIKDVADRLIRNYTGKNSDADTMPEDAIVIARDLAPSETVVLDKSRVRAFVTEVGSKTSHSAIMSRSMGIPAVVGVPSICETVSNGMVIIVDGFEGLLILNPTQAHVEDYHRKLEEYQDTIEKHNLYKGVRLAYRSGRLITVAGNIGSVKDMEQLLAQGTKSVGLFRTEFLFMGRSSMPAEDEQYLAYKTVAELAQGESVVIRTLDIGGDKTIPYMNMPKEDNSFLGLRAIRLCFEEKLMFKTQIKALLRAAVHGNIQIMFPMIGSLDELRQAKKVIEECKHELEMQGFAFRSDTPVGIMIEIPAAAIMARMLAKEVDFFSIGTNDLVQYTLAVDRMNPKVAHLYNPFHPAVLDLIRNTIEAAHEAGIWCGMCGELASDLNATQLLAQFELDEFSVSAGSVLSLSEALLQQINVIGCDEKHAT